MIVLSLSSISKYYGAEPILQDISFTLQQGDRFGIVGVNGAGKTTLLRIISGILPPDGGEMHFASGLKPGYLKQDSEYTPTSTAYEEMLSVFSHAFAVEARMREIETLLGETHTSDPALYKKLSAEYSRLTDQFDEANGYGYQSAILGVLRGLGFSEEEIYRNASTLSGGQQSRLALGKILLQKPPILLLDEPTNHLDLESIAWLEEYVRNYKGTVIVVSHDRYFLDAVCNRIGEVSFGRMETYEGNYSTYVRRRTELRKQQEKAYEMNQRELKRQEDIIATYRRFNREKSIKAAQSREKRLEKMERLEKPKEEQSIRFAFDVAQHTGEDILIAEGLSKAFDAPPLFQNLDLHIRAGDSLGIVGRNGIGKTTLLRILSDQIPATTGNFRWGAGVQIGYYDQKHGDLTPHKTVIDEVWDTFPQMSVQKIRDTLAAFLFRADDIEKTIESLSGGEKSRVALIKLLLGNYNVLLLDEPTNHLDADSCQVLEDALKEFQGTLIFVSHDRYFINRIANRILEIKEDHYTDYPGNWENYLQHLYLRSRPQVFNPLDDLTATQRKKQERQNRERAEALLQKRRNIRDLENRISAVEKEIADIEAALLNPAALSPGEINEYSLKHSEKQQETETLLKQWELANEELERESEIKTTS